MLKLLRRIFGNAKTADDTKVPYMRTPAYMKQVEKNLERQYGMSIERHNLHIPELRVGQFDRDVANTRNARLGNPRRIENNTRSLQ
jgi:hypothetical protein